MEKPSSLPPNYVTLRQLQELRLREKHRQEEEEEERGREKEAKLRGVKAEEEEERLKASRAEPSKPRKPSYRNRCGNGSRRRNVAPTEACAEVEQAADRDAMGGTSESSKPGGDDGEGEGAVDVGGDVIDGKDSKKKKNKNSRKEQKKWESRTGTDGSNRDGPRERGENRPVWAPGGEPTRTAEISSHFGEEPQNGPEKIDPIRSQVGEKGENRRSGSTPERAVVIARQVEHQPDIGGDGEKRTERRRRTAGRGDGWFSRGRKTVIGPGQGLVWVRKGSAS